MAALRRREPLVLAVVPFEQVVGAIGDGTEARELTGLPGAGERARQDERESVTNEARPERASRLLAGGSQREIGAAGVPSRTAPLRLTGLDNPEPRPVG